MGGKVNKKLIEKSIMRSKSVQKQVRNIVEKEVLLQKSILKAEFISHPVTQELEGAENARNISGTLGGYGNLFSFLGFDRGANPTTSVKLLINKINLSKNVQITKDIFRFTVNLPSKEDFGAVTKMPWEVGRSWLFDVERGISGLGAYLYGRFKSSRSSTGIQSNVNYSGRVFRTVKYFNFMYNKFVKKIGGLSK